jgi:hypothetical protein
MISFLLINLALAAPVSEADLTRCYAQFPMTQDLLMGIADNDFANSKKAADRKKSIQASFVKKPTELRSCYEKIVSFAKEQNDPQNLKYVVLRLKEVAIVIYGAGAADETKNPIR